jgi:adenylate cyclase
MVEEIITALCRVRWFFVIARNSSFTYKGRSVDIRQVGRELGVRYVLEGSIRKAGSRVRVTGQLIEAANGRHVWAERFDGELADIFDLQDRITESVVGAIEPSISRAEIERSSAKPTNDLDAYDLYMQALAHYYALTKPANDEALRLLGCRLP